MFGANSVKKMNFDFNKYRRFVFLIADVCCLLASSILVWVFLRVLPSVIHDISKEALCINTAIYVVVTMTALMGAGAYKPLWRYATMRDLLSCIFGVVFGAAFSFATVW